MGIAGIILVALGLSMDAFAVAITLGLAAGGRPTMPQALLTGAYFGLFQAFMPVVGYLAGAHFADRIETIDHWVAFVLLGAIGAKMIWDSFSREEKKPGRSPFRPANLLVLAVATSIDALAVGVTFAFLRIDIITAVAVIGVTTFALSTVGVKIGSAAEARFRSKAELFGGIVLVIIGIKILIEHLAAH
ncbi:MAG: manganese efflux pump MntP family protein [Rikenellaceae bacterium]|nr:manganese efflux pump MntP family protein [Rikenellaceae bacterium]MCL2692630.1 manganese efflux pump MntP family protein [Rikenellaceae bacterium]